MMESIDFREEATMKVTTEFKVSAKTPSVVESFVLKGVHMAGCQKCSAAHLALDNED